MCYTGDKERRAELQTELLDDRHFHVLLTTYEVSVWIYIMLSCSQKSLVVVLSGNAHRPQYCNLPIINQG